MVLGTVETERKSNLIKFLISFGVAALIAFAVIAIKGFFTDSIAVNVQILSDAFTVSGLLFTLFSGLLFISGEGALLGIGFVLRNVVLAFIPAGRLRHEKYADYRERKLAAKKERKYNFILITGLVFLAVGIILTVIWYTKFYTPPGA